MVGGQEGHKRRGGLRGGGTPPAGILLFCQ